MKLKASEIARAIGAPEPACDITVSDYITDSRSLRNPGATVFFAVRTPSGDGHAYVARLFARGVRVFVIDDPRFAVEDSAIYLIVNNVGQALLDLGAYCRTKLHGAVIGVTGSVGKTQFKEMLYAATGYSAAVQRSPRSWNSQVGVPLALASFSRTAEDSIVEAGVSHAGEMQRLAQVVRPDIGVFTALTAEHASGFGSPEDKCREKALLFGSAHTIYYLEDEMVEHVLRDMYPDKKLVQCADYPEMARAVLEGVNIAPAEFETTPVSPRIDFVDSQNHVTLAVDHFTADVDGIANGLDMVRRRLGDQVPLTVVLCGVCGDNPLLEKILTFYGTSKAIILSDSFKPSFKGIGSITYKTVREFVADTSSTSFYDECVYINGADKDSVKETATWLSSARNITRLEVDLDALTHNFKEYQRLLPKDVGIIGMVKADGYGCGAVEVARTLQTCGAAKIAVAVVDEGVALRRNGVTLPIIVLDPWCDNLRAIFANNLEPTVIDGREETLRAISQAAVRQGYPTANVHLKLDTGMHRIGLNENEIDEFVKVLRKYPDIRVRSVFSHLATADDPHHNDYTQTQIAAFERMTSHLAALLPYTFERHLFNTAAMMRYGQHTTHDMCRLGIGLYGIAPSDSLEGEMTLQPVARLVTRVIAVKDYPAGTTIGYGRRGLLTRESVIATIPVGYADGLNRALGNGKVSFAVNGKLCPTVGNICMDLCMIDVTGVENPQDAEVEIFGENVAIQTVAEAIGTIPYEVLATVSPRVKRVYHKG